MSDFNHFVLNELDIASYEELVSLGTDEVLRRMDERNPSLHPSDSFLALMVLGAIGELRAGTADIKAAVVSLEHTTEALDHARKRLDRLVAVLAALALVAALLQLA
jgi:hypothetical protein